MLKIGELLGKMSQKDKQSYISKVRSPGDVSISFSYAFTHLRFICSRVRCIQGVSNYWDNAVPVVDNGVPVSGQVGESKTQDSVSVFVKLAYD